MDMTFLHLSGMVRRLVQLLALASVAIFLNGCVAGVDGELTGYIADVKERPGGRIDPLPTIKPYENFTYQVDNMRSPFAPDRPNSPSAISGPKPVKDRSKEYLEQFPLDTLAMVGTLEREGSTFGLVQTQDGMVHRVTSGNFVGQNDGRIVEIDGSVISIEELVADGIGSFYKRAAEIGLSD
jgi:type IV pilus assembly protein PilP